MFSFPAIILANKNIISRIVFKNINYLIYRSEVNGVLISSKRSFVRVCFDMGEVFSWFIFMTGE